MIQIALKSWPDPDNVVEPELKRRATLWKKWCEDCADKILDICRDVDGGSNPAKIKPTTSLYARKSIKPIHFMDKTGPFRGKCVYCESFITDFQRGDIEHFRPKGAVTNASGKAVMIRDRNDEEKAHWGYYWLTYAKLNLMPSCQLCNQPASDNLGKRTRFPVEDEMMRVRYHDDNLDAEIPMLINPLVENPAKHLRVETTGKKTGFMIAETPRGQACIDIFGLNQRDQLVASRRTAVQKINLLWQRPEENGVELKRLLVDAVEPHTLASRCAYRQKMAALSMVKF